MVLKPAKGIINYTAPVTCDVCEEKHAEMYVAEKERMCGKCYKKKMTGKE
jgi:hypothetical protein